MDSPERSDRIRAALSNAGFAIPPGGIWSVTPPDTTDRYAPDLALALCVLLSDRTHEHLQRDGWIAWGALRLDGTLGPVEEPMANDLGAGPFVGRVWDPTDHIPEAHEDAVMSLIQVKDLHDAWDVVTSLAEFEAKFVEEEVYESAGP